MITRTNYSINDNTISALTTGDPSHPLALFLHGIPASAELWRDILPAISREGWYCIAPDCPGYGDTHVQADHLYTVEGSAGLFLEWIHQQGWSDIWLVGHDIGGGIAQLMITQEEGLFQKMTLSNCATADLWPVPIIKLLILTSKLGLFPFAAKTNLARWLGQNSLKKGFYNSNNLTDKVKNRIFFDSKMKTREGRKKFAKLLRHLNSDSTQNNMEALSRITTPIHIVWGMADPHQPWETTGETLNNQITNKQITKLQGAGHFLQLDAPEKYVEAIKDTDPH